MPPSISDRLKALGVKVGAQELKPPPAAPPEQLESALEGQWVQTPHGEAFIVERRYPFGQPYGGSALEISAPLGVLADWVGDERIRALPPEAIAFLDTETTGLSGGTGTYAFLIGVGRFAGAEFILQQIFMRDPLDEIGQLAALEAFLAPCQAVATFNGKAFDIPLLLTRFMAQGLRAPFFDLAHIDLLHMARRLWRDRLPSRTLSNLEVQILGAARTEEDIPGWLIPEIYFTYLRDRDPAPLKNVFYHNAMDVLSLAALLNHIGWLLSDPLQLGGRFGIDLIALAKLFEDLGDLDRATLLYVQALEHEDAIYDRVPRPALLQAFQRLAQIRKRQNELQAAIQLWEQAAYHAHLEAHVELAKCYEHQMKDYGLAIQWTETAIALIETSPQTNSTDLNLTAYQRRQWTIELQHRLSRLRRKLGSD
jgi:hypothetical protein